MKNLLIVVDMQNDFITGALGTKEARAILPDVVELVRSWDGPVAFTRDTHTPDYLNTQEGRNLPVPHCIRDTPGLQIADPLRPFAEKAAVFDKPSFGSPELAAWCREQAPAARDPGPGHRPLLRLRLPPEPRNRPGRHETLPGGHRGMNRI